MRNVAGYQVQVERSKGNGPIEVTIAPGTFWVLRELRLHLDAAGGTSEDFNVSVDSEVDEFFDTLIVSEDMLLISDFVYIPDSPCSHSLGEGDKLLFQYANTNHRKWGLEVIYSLE